MSRAPSRPFWLLAELDGERRRRGMSHAELARAIDPAAPVKRLRLKLYRLLTGHEPRADLALLDKVAEYFGLDLDLVPKDPAAKRRAAA